MVEQADILNAKILVVDDQEANVRLLQQMLAIAGYGAVTVTQDPTAVCQLHRENRYDLILLDLQMPVMDGFEVMKGLKELEKDAYMPVLVITAQPDHKLRALRAGAKDFVTKPFDLAEVQMRVRNMLEVRLYAQALSRTIGELEESRELIRGKNEELKKLFQQVIAERKVSERLALFAPAGSISERLQSRADVTADNFAEVTVLIVDVIGFADLTPAATTPQLAALLEEVFAMLDGIAIDHDIKKVKTLGNSYMAAAGVPVPSPDHAAQAAHMALDAIDAMTQFNARHDTKLQLRIGIGTGAAVAGVIGRRLFLYDVWGEAVISASYMESHCVAGKIQLSEGTRRLLGSPFVLEDRGELNIDGKGNAHTWHLTARNGSSHDSRRARAD